MINEALNHSMAGIVIIGLDTDLAFILHQTITNDTLCWVILWLWHNKIMYNDNFIKMNVFLFRNIICQFNWFPNYNYQYLLGNGKELIKTSPTVTKYTSYWKQIYFQNTKNTTYQDMYCGFCSVPNNKHDKDRCHCKVVQHMMVLHTAMQK